MKEGKKPFLAQLESISSEIPFKVLKIGSMNVLHKLKKSYTLELWTAEQTFLFQPLSVAYGLGWKLQYIAIAIATVIKIASHNKFIN